MKGLLQNVVIGVVSLTVGLLFLPLLQSGIDALTGVGMTYADTTVGTILDIIPVVVVSGITFATIKSFMGSKAV